MLGAVVGDIVGSIHEFVAIPTKTKDFGPLFVTDMNHHIIQMIRYALWPSLNGC